MFTEFCDYNIHSKKSADIELSLNIFGHTL